MNSSTPSASRSESIFEIVTRLASAQKSNRGAPAYSRWINRPSGRFFAAIAFKTGRTPNQVTVASATVTFTAIVLLAVLRPTPVIGVIIAVILALGFALDAADGQLARLRGGGSPAGEWLDHVADCIKCSALHMAVLICWFRFYDLSPEALLLIPLAYGLQSAVWFFTIILSEQLRRSVSGVKSSTMPKSDEPAPILRSLLITPADYGLLCVSFVLLGFHPAFVWVYTALMLFNVVLLLAAFVKWYRELSAIGKVMV